MGGPVCVLVGAAAPLLVAPTGTPYQAEGCRRREQLTVNPRCCPRSPKRCSATARWRPPSRRTRDGGQTGTGLVPDQVSVVTGPDSITMVVQFRDADPGTAAHLADLAANAFAAELNRAGAGVGLFAVQSTASHPHRPARDTSDPCAPGWVRSPA